MRWTHLSWLLRAGCLVSATSVAEPARRTFDLTLSGTLTSAIELSVVEPPGSIPPSSTLFPSGHGVRLQGRSTYNFQFALDVVQSGMSCSTISAALDATSPVPGPVRLAAEGEPEIRLLEGAQVVAHASAGHSTLPFSAAVDVQDTQADGPFSIKILFAASPGCSK